MAQMTVRKKTITAGDFAGQRFVLRVELSKTELLVLRTVLADAVQPEVAPDTGGLLAYAGRVVRDLDFALREATKTPQGKDMLA